MKLFRKEKIDQEFEEENTLIFHILKEKDFNTLKKILGFLGYSSPGMWLNEEKEEWMKVFKNPSCYSERAFITKRYEFKSSIKPYKQVYYEAVQERIFRKLCFGLINNTFNNLQNSIENLNELLNNFININNCIPDVLKFNPFISHMDTKLKNRISSERSNQSVKSHDNQENKSSSRFDNREKNETNYITFNLFIFSEIDGRTQIHNTEIKNTHIKNTHIKNTHIKNTQVNNTEINNNIIVNSIHDDRVGIQFKLISDIELFDDFCQKLFDFGFISSLELFKNPFLGKMVKDGERSKWNLNLNALAFLVIIMRNIELVHAPYDIYKAINESFRDKDGKDINSGSLSTQSSRIGLTSLGKDIKTINEYVSQSTNNDIKLIYYHTFLTTYTELRDSLD